MPDSPFSTDSMTRLLAFKWAANYFRSVEVADAFVTFLASLDADEQAYIFNNGFARIAVEFESR